eukprot:TRINITY_DN12127_c0_g2_i1.p1 TRINITY_DN12127_c0_g2~~TRINITY_DN12127_c0_g2_i1.p1  ORF type:complete len:390 (+),score=45.32 TRINITY_DN12127_c0_g2_i1:43-1170(+)
MEVAAGHVESSQFRSSLPKRLILVRHGESEGNIDHRIYESVADGLLHLTEKGWQQGTCAGRALKDIIGDENVEFKVSPYVRTRETFNALVAPWGTPDDVRWAEDPRLREQDFGNFQNVADVEKAKEERGEFGPFYYRMPNGESPADVYDRLSSFFESMYRHWERLGPNVTDNLNYVIVCHGVTIAVFLMRLFKYSVDDFHRYANFTNAEFCVMDRQPSGRYSKSRMYCVKQVETAPDSGDWQPQRGPRSVRRDAGRFDRSIRTAPPSQMQPSMSRETSVDDTFSTVEFVTAERSGFRCNDDNLVETILPGTQSDYLNIMPGWYLVEVNQTEVPPGGAAAAVKRGKTSGPVMAVKFRIPSKIAFSTSRTEQGYCKI